MTRARPEKPDFLVQPTDRTKSRQAQVERLKLKLERTYRMWLNCRSPELKEVFESIIAEAEDRIAYLERLIAAAD